MRSSYLKNTKPIDPELLEEFRQEMISKVIPEIKRVLKERDRMRFINFWRFY